MNGAVRPRPSTAFATVDLDCPGKQVGFVMFPHSPHEDAWGVTRVPLTVVANGVGPTVVLAGGNHGDEYEGQIVIGELARDLNPECVRGRIILMPALNTPAVVAGKRVSPHDGLNFNRTFPGNPVGAMTEQISAYVFDHIFPRADAFIDLHSGGSSLNCLVSVNIEPAEDAALAARIIAAARAFGAPLIILNSNLGEARTATAAACKAGILALATEMAGGGGVSIEALRTCRQGILNVLTHLGALLSNPAERAHSLPEEIRRLAGPDAFVFATHEGVFEPKHELGTEVRAGAIAGYIHCVWNPALRPEQLVYRASGILYGSRRPGRVAPGNCCLVVASELGI